MRKVVCKMQKVVCKMQKVEAVYQMAKVVYKMKKVVCKMEKVVCKMKSSIFGGDGTPYWSCIFRNLSRFGSYNVYLIDTRISNT